MDDNSPTVVSGAVQMNWYRRAYVGGDGTIPTYNDAFLKTLMNKAGSGTGGATFSGQAANTSIPYAGRSFRFSVTLADEYMFIAYDAGHGDLTAVKDKNNSDFNVLGAFTLAATVAVTTENVAAISENYKIYVSNQKLTGTFDYETV